jgi:hypothetical protein
MAEREIRILTSPPNAARSAIICVRLLADRCEVGGRLYPVTEFAARLRAPVHVDAVIMSLDKIVRTCDVLVITDSRGAEIGRSPVNAIELSHTDLLTEADQRLCTVEALADAKATWALALSSGPIWCFHLTESLIYRVGTEKLKFDVELSTSKIGNK